MLTLSTVHMCTTDRSRCRCKSSSRPMCTAHSDSRTAVEFGRVRQHRIVIGRRPVVKPVVEDHDGRARDAREVGGKIGRS